MEENNDNNDIAGASNYSTVHMLPFSINYSGPAPVNAYFHVESSSSNNPNKQDTTYNSHFRGRQLKGVKVDLPVDVIGVQLRPTDHDFKELESINTFKSVYIWEHDKAPDSHLKEALNWLEISKSVSP